MRKAPICLFMLALLLIHSAQGRDLWVDNKRGSNCDDARDREDVTESEPWCTLGMAGSKTRAGDTVRVREGEYTQVQDTALSDALAVLQLTVRGEPDNPIRIVADPEVSIIPDASDGARWGIYAGPASEGSESIDPQYIEIEGFKIRDAEAACVEIFDTGNIVLRDLDVSNCSRAIEFENTTNVTLESSSVHDNELNNNTSAVDLFLCGEGHVIRGNRIWNNTLVDGPQDEGHGVIMDTCLGNGGAVIEDNVIFDNHGWCLVLFASDNATVRNNICKTNGTGSPTQFGQTIGEMTMVTNNSEISGNTSVSRNGSLALNVRVATQLPRTGETFPSDFSTINIDDNNWWSPGDDEIIVIADNPAVDVPTYQATNSQGWGQNDTQVEPGWWPCPDDAEDVCPPQPTPAASP